LHIGVSGNPIDPHTRLAVIMRFLAGGQLADLVDIYVGWLLLKPTNQYGTAWMPSTRPSQLTIQYWSPRNNKWSVENSGVVQEKYQHGLASKATGMMETKRRATMSATPSSWARCPLYTKSFEPKTEWIKGADERAVLTHWHTDIVSLLANKPSNFKSITRLRQAPTRSRDKIFSLSLVIWSVLRAPAWSPLLGPTSNSKINSWLFNSKSDFVSASVCRLLSYSPHLPAAGG